MGEGGVKKMRDDQYAKKALKFRAILFEFSIKTAKIGTKMENKVSKMLCKCRY